MVGTILQMELKIITYNIRIQSKERFAERADRVAEMINGSGADIVCFQELSDKMQSLLLPLMTDYTFVGGFRDGDRLGEGTPVAFKRERFCLADLRTSWLSHTPRVPGSRYGGDQSSCPRVCSMLTLVEYASGTAIRLYNTHLDHVGCEARLLGAEQILSDMADDGAYTQYPVILTGDLNSAPNIPTIDMIRRAGGLIDVTAHIKRSFTNDDREFHKWQEEKIDYIFVSPDVSCTECDVLEGDDFGTCGSDHFAILATLSIN